MYKYCRDHCRYTIAATVTLVWYSNVVHDIDSDDKELQCALHASREEEQFARVSREGGGGIMSTSVVHLNNKVACLEG
jgi:hypothetical protein